MKETELDDWFFNLEAGWQEEITKILRKDYGITEETDGTEECDLFYEMYDSAVADWWDGLNYRVKALIYERETSGASV